MAGVKVNIEYCGECGHKKQFMEISEQLKENVPGVEIAGSEKSKEGAFEIKVNDALVYSKLQTLAFPDYSEVVSVTKEVSEGMEPRQITKQQPIECAIM